MNNFTHNLRTHNLKATPQRLAILDTIERYGHINIDTLYEEIKTKFQSISLATIYKNINAMIKNSLLCEVKIPTQKSVYEIIKEEHAHLVCSKCNNVTDIKIDLSKIINNISHNDHFIINKSDLVLSGICAKCQK